MTTDTMADRKITVLEEGDQADEWILVPQAVSSATVLDSMSPSATVDQTTRWFISTTVTSATVDSTARVIASATTASVCGNSTESSTVSLIHQHYLDVCATLAAFRQYKLTVKRTKVHLFRNMIKFCGHVLFNGQRKAAPSKLEAISKWTVDMVKTVSHLKGFLGLCQYYSQYMQDFARIALPLTEQLKGRKDAPKTVLWTTRMKTAFETLKTELLKNVVLDIASPHKPYCMEVDASDFAIGGVLSQHDDAGQLRPVAFFSGKLYGTPGKETSRLD